MKSFLLFLPLLAAMPARAEQEVTVEEFLQKLSTVPDVVSRKDPFVSPTPSFMVNQQADGGSMANAPVLERYPLAQYNVVATLLGDQYPRALVKLPDIEKGKVLIVKEKDKLGQSGGVISKILKDGILVVQMQKSPLGYVDKSEVMLKIGTSKPNGQN